MKNFLDKLKLNIPHLLALLLLLSIFIPVRKVFPTNTSFSTGEYSDFLTISLYLSDIILFLLFFWLILKRKLTTKPKKLIIYLISYIILAYLANIYPNIAFPTFFLIKLLELIVLHETAKSYFLAYPEKLLSFFHTLVLFSLFVSIVGIVQFALQSFIGLGHYFGESSLSSLNFGIAKVSDNLGLVFLRPYSLFPHPNIFSAFLFTALIIQICLILKEKWLYNYRLAYASLFTLIFTLFLTFSRSGLLAFFISLSCIVAFSLINKGEFSSKIKAFTVIAIAIVLSSAILWPLYQNRVNSNDESVINRISYNKIGYLMLKSNPIVGFGPGDSLLHMQQFSEKKLETWEIQPIHNYFLLSATEIGIPGALLIIILFVSYLINLFKLSIKSKDSNALLLFALLIGFMTLMLFDHYFWTLEQPQFLLWIVLGLISSKIYKNLDSHETYDQPKN